MCYEEMLYMICNVGNRVGYCISKYLKEAYLDNMFWWILTDIF